MPVKNVTISFPPSGSPDVVSYNLYVQEAPDAVDYNSEVFDLGASTTVDLSTLPGMQTKDSTYNLGITAVDDAGNESSMSVIADVALDFTEPDPPGQITITRA